MSTFTPAFTGRREPDSETPRVPQGACFLELKERLTRVATTPLPLRVKVAAIVPGTGENGDFARDIVVQDMSLRLQRISENHPSVIGVDG